MSDLTEKIAQDAREKEAKTELSEDGMAMDADEVPRDSAENPDETAVTPAHHDG